MKRFLFSAIMAILPLSLWCFTITIDGVTYTYEVHDEKHTMLFGIQDNVVKMCSVTDVDGDLPQTLVIPESLDGYTVVYFGSPYSSQGKEAKPQVKEIRLPLYCRVLGRNAFSRFTSLERITMESHTEHIYPTAFQECPNLKEVKIYALKPPVSDMAWSGNPTACKPFGQEQFANAKLYVRPGCKDEYMQAWEWSDFANVEEMECEEYRDGDERTGYVEGVPYVYTILSTTEKTCLFGRKVVNSVIEWPEDWTGNDPRDMPDWLAVSRTTRGRIAIPEAIDGFTVTALGYKCLYSTWLYGINEIVIPETVTTICGAIYKERIPSLSIPASVTHIGPWVIQADRLTVDDKNQVYDSRNGCNAIIHSASNTLVRLGAVGRIPDGVKAIGDFAAAYISMGPDLELPSSVAELGVGAFCGTELQKVIIPPSITEIPAHLFDRCMLLESVDLHKEVKSIGNGAFDYCKQLKAVISRNENPFGISDDVFGPEHESVILFVPDGTVALYQSTPCWNKFHDIREISDYLQGIGSNTDVHGKETPYHSINGIRLPSLPTQKGIYIKDGKKVLIK